MANPMQRRSKNSFLLGVLTTLVLAAIVIALLILQLKNYKEETISHNSMWDIIK